MCVCVSECLIVNVQSRKIYVCAVFPFMCVLVLLSSISFVVVYLHLLVLAARERSKNEINKVAPKLS